MMALKSDADCNVLERQVKHEMGVRNNEETQQKKIKYRIRRLKMLCVGLHFFLTFTSQVIYLMLKGLFFFPVSCW